jgi:hypothetical protein
VVRSGRANNPEGSSPPPRGPKRLRLRKPGGCRFRVGDDGFSIVLALGQFLEDVLMDGALSYWMSRFTVLRQ